MAELLRCGFDSQLADRNVYPLLVIVFPLSPSEGAVPTKSLNSYSSCPVGTELSSATLQPKNFFANDRMSRKFTGSF
jgi:hypothetical protein